MRRSLSNLFSVTLLVSMTASAEVPPLSLNELRACASQVQQLRSESIRLVELSPRNDLKRNTINARTAALKAERARLSADDLKAGLDFHQRNKAHHAETLAFNAEMAQYRNDVVAVNTLKSRYDQRCNGRPYRRSDLDALPEAERHAMQIGLSDIEIPYLYPSYTTPSSRVAQD